VSTLTQVATVGVAGWALIYARGGHVREARESRERATQPRALALLQAGIINTESVLGLDDLPMEYRDDRRRA
jgi:hypothetical protein